MFYSPETYRRSDVETQHALIVEAHRLARFKLARLTPSGLPIPEPFDLALALARASARAHFALHGRSKYMPHQGKRECARRRRQMGVAS